MPAMLKCPRTGCTFSGTEEEVDDHQIYMDKHSLHEAQISDDPKPFCIGCYKVPAEIMEYSKESTDSNLEPDEYVKREEGTYNEENGHFLCTSCYIRVGQPSSPGGWKAP